MPGRQAGQPLPDSRRSSIKIKNVKILRYFPDEVDDTLHGYGQFRANLF